MFYGPRSRAKLTDYATSVVAVYGLNFKNSDNHARKIWTMGDKLWLKTSSRTPFQDLLG